jgi:hypothetical protein
MCNIYKRGLIPTTRKQFGTGSVDWQLQEDNDPQQPSRLATQWKIDHDVNVVDWPSSSPDIAPIENVWHLIKMKLKKEKIHKL